MRASAAWPQDANKIVWVSEHDALRADMDDLAAAIGALDSQLAAGKALTAWQVRAFLGSTTSVLQPVLHAGHGGARRSSAPPASCVAPRPTGEAARGVRERQREHGEWRSGRLRARQHRGQRVLGRRRTAAADACCFTGRRQLLSALAAPAGGHARRRVGSVRALRRAPPHQRRGPRSAARALACAQQPALSLTDGSAGVRAPPRCATATRASSFPGARRGAQA